MPSALSINKGRCSHQAITLQPPLQGALRELSMETGCLTSNSQRLQLPPVVRGMKRGMKKPRILALDS